VKGFTGRTMCLANKHDLTQPGVVGVTQDTGRKYCLACKRERRKEREKKQRYCRGCRKPLAIGKAWAFCATDCERKYYSRKGSAEELDNNSKTLELMTLYEELDRAATSWERADIRAKIAAVK